MADDDRFSRRSLLAAGGALAGAALGGANAQAATPGPSVPADTGAVQGNRVLFPNWRGPGDPTPAPSPAPQPPEQRVGYCIVGLGRLTLDEILPAFGETKRSRIVALMSGSPDKAKLVARQHGLPDDAVYGYDEWDRLKQNKQVQAVYVVTPNAVHRDNVVAASNAGKHVLCEKPMAVSSPECREMIEACARGGVKLMIAYRCQYEPFNRALTKAVRGGSLGKARLIQAFNGQTTGLPEQWRLRKALAGGGSLPDIGLYCLNGTRALLGEEPEMVQAIASSPPDDPKFKEVEETITFTLRFPSGTIAQCIASYGVHESRSLTVHTQTGVFDLQNAFAYRGQRLFVGRSEGKSAARDEKLLSPKNQFALEIDHFSRCIQENLKPRTPGEEGLQDQILMEALYESARTGAPVKTGPLPGTGAGLDATRGPEPEEAA